MGKIINYDDFCKEVDKGDLLIGNNAEWAKEIAWRTPEAKGAVPFPSDKRNKDGNITVTLTAEERIIVYCALGIQIKNLEMEQIKLEKEIEKSSNPQDIEQCDHNAENLMFFNSIAKKFEMDVFQDFVDGFAEAFETSFRNFEAKSSCD